MRLAIWARVALSSVRSRSRASVMRQSRYCFGDCPSNSFAERWVGTARRECLNHLLIAGRRRLQFVLKEFVEHYGKARPHQGLEQRTPSGQPAERPLAAGRIVRQDRLGGLIPEYDRAAA